jgi:hypothetical protein
MGYTFFCFSMDRLMTPSGAQPTVETESLLVQNVGRRDFSHGNSFRSKLEDHPLIDHAMMDSERRIALNQEVDVVLHDLGPEQDAVRFVSDLCGASIWTPSRNTSQRSISSPKKRAFLPKAKAKGFARTFR